MTDTEQATPMSYSEASSRLEELLNMLQGEEVDIDQLGGLVKEAAALVTLCRGKIESAEVEVKTITEQLERAAAGDAGETSAGGTSAGGTSAGADKFEAPPPEDGDYENYEEDE